MITSFLKIKTWLIGFVVLTITCLLAMGFYNYTEINKMQEKIDRIEQQVTMSVIKAKDMSFSIIQVQQWLTDASATGDNEGFDKADEFANKFRTNAKFLQDNDTGHSSQIEQILTDFEPYYTTGQKMANVYIKEGREAGNALMPEFDGVAEKLSSEINKYVENNVQEMNNTIKETESLMQIMRISSIVIFGIISIVLVIGCLLLIKKILPPLKNLQYSMDDIHKGEGDLTKRISSKSNDEIAEVVMSFNGIMDNLQDIILKIKNNSESLSEQSQLLASSSEEVSATIEEVASVTYEVASISSQGAENLETAVEESKNMHFIAGEGNMAVKETVEKINSIALVSQKAAKVIKNLGEKSNQIGEIITAITNVADQTNLLALNAAIEAARAGEHGRGFAVVAEEVRKLAEQSSQASNKITELIKQIQLGVSEAVAAIESSVAEVDEGVLVANNAGTALGEIIKAVEKNTIIIQDVAKGSIQVSEGTQQLSTSNEQITSATQQVSSTAQELANIASELYNTVTKFKV